MRIQSIFFAVAVAILSAFTGCAVHLPNGANLQYRGHHVSADVNLQTEQSARMVPAVVSGVVCPRGKSLGILHLPSDPKNGEEVCAFPGDVNVKFFNRGERAPIPRSFNQDPFPASRCPSGYRMNSQGSWMCRD